MSVRLVLLGPPGSGKGTLATKLGEVLAVPHISTGEIFRQEIGRQSALGRSVHAYVSSGRLVPDALVVKVMVSRLTSRLLRQGFVFDGFPRTVGQAQGLDQALNRKRHPLLGALYLQCPTSVLISRLSGRRVCGSCGAIYHLRNMPPKRVDRCDRCGQALITRKDDRVDTIKERLRIDQEQAKPLVKYYRRKRLLYPIRSANSNDHTLAQTLRLMRRKGWIAAARTSKAHDRAQNT